MKTALTIAGSDSSGGAGIQADLKTFSAHGVFGMSVITSVTAQNTQQVLAVEDISPNMIGKQIDAIFTDIHVDAVKIGMVSRKESILAIVDRLKYYNPSNLVLDPVMVSKSGYDLLRPQAVDILIKELIPLATIVTPNIPEGERITGMDIKTIDMMEKAAMEIHMMGPENVMIKGGHLEGEATDVFFDGSQFVYLESPRINTKNTHGTGCTLSSAIASNLALGLDMKQSVQEAKEYIIEAIRYSLDIGNGAGPTNHFYKLYQQAGLFKKHSN